MNYYGDFSRAKTVRLRFNTVSSAGVPTTLSSGAVTVSKDGADVTPSGGVTLTTDAGSVTGRHTVVVDMSVDTTTFTAGSEYAVRLSGTANVGGTSVVGIVVGEWSVENRSVAVDASGRIQAQSGTGAGQLNLASGRIGINWADVANPTTAVNLSGTTISTSQSVASVAGAVGSVTGAVGSVGGNVGGNVQGNVVGTIGGYASGQDPATLVLDATASGHNTAGTIGNKINSAASAGDPWNTALPGSYASGTAGNIVGNRLDAAVSTRSTFSGGAVTSVTNPVAVNLAATLGSPRALDTVADGALTIGDALFAACCAAAGKETVVGTTYTVKTPFTGFALRTFTLDNGAAPTSRT